MLCTKKECNLDSVLLGVHNSADLMIFACHNGFCDARFNLRILDLLKVKMHEKQKGCLLKDSLLID